MASRLQHSFRLGRPKIRTSDLPPTMPAHLTTLPLWRFLHCIFPPFKKKCLRWSFLPFCLFFARLPTLEIRSDDGGITTV